MKYLQLFEDFTLNEHRYTSHKPFEYFWNLIINHLKENKTKTFKWTSDNGAKDPLNRYDLMFIRLDEIINAKHLTWDKREQLMMEGITDENGIDYIHYISSQFRFGICYGEAAPQAVYNNYIFHYIALRTDINQDFWDDKWTYNDLLNIFDNKKAKRFLAHEFTHFVDNTKILAHQFMMHKKFYKNAKSGESNKRKSPQQMGYKNGWKDYWNNTHEFNAYVNMMLMDIDVNEYPTFQEYFDEVIKQLTEDVPRFIENISPENKKKMMKVVYDYYANYSRENKRAAE
jgi:hypothetical protein